MSIRNLFYWSYWFKQPYLLRGTGLILWLAAFFGLVLVGLLALLMKNQQTEMAIKRFYSRVASATLTMGIVGLVWLFLRQQQVPFLAWRFWLLIWLGIFLGWAVPLIIYYFKRIPVIKSQNEERAKREQYLR